MRFELARLAFALMALGVAAEINAIFHERMMHRHRRPGVSYWTATLRRDGGWQRAELFDEAGLAHQRRAASWGVSGIALVVVGLIVLAVA